MDIENIKRAKFKKYILIILMIFAIMVILPGFISSLATKVNAYKFESISGKHEWNTSEDCAELYQFLYNIDMDGGKLPEYRY